MLRKPNVLFLLIFVPIYVIFYFHLLIFTTGHLSWGNFVPPESLPQFRSGFFIFWNPYSDNSSINPYPFIGLLGFLPNGLIMILSSFTGIMVGTKIYLLLASLFLSFSFFVFSRGIFDNLTAGIISTFFFSFNPIQIQVISFGGDYNQFLFEGFFLFSLYFLIDSLTKDRRSNLSMLISIFLLVISVFFIQVFVVGLTLYIVFALFVHLLMREGSLKSRVIDFSKFLTRFIIILIPASLPITYLAFLDFGSFVGAAGVTNLVGILKLNSVPLIEVLLLFGYPSGTIMLPLQSILSPVYFQIWEYLFAVFIGFLFLSPAFTKDKRMVYFLVFAVGYALLGSGTDGPLSAITVYFYLHLPGYSSLNGSYFWEWIPLSLIYSLMVGILVQDLSVPTLKLKQAYFKIHPTRQFLFINKKSRFGFTMVVILMLILLSASVATQGYYSSSTSNGIHTNDVPPSYQRIPYILDSLVGSNYYSVAYFPPDGWDYFENHPSFTNPLTVYEIPRTIGTPEYGTPNTQYLSYFFWVYNLFYQNETHNIATLLGIADVKYFLVFNNLKDSIGPYFSIYNNENASQLMSYQNDISPILKTSSYTIYENMLNLSTINSFTSFTIISGGYNVLEELASGGINLLGLNLFYSSQLTAKNEYKLLDKTNIIITNGSDGLVSLALSFENATEISPLNYSTSRDVLNGWQSSENIYFRAYVYGKTFPDVVFSSFSPYSITFTASNLTFDIYSAQSGNFSLLLNLLFSSYGSQLKVLVNGMPEKTINTSAASSGTYGAFSWVQIPVTFKNGLNRITVESANGLNGIENIAYGNQGIITNSVNSFVNKIKSLGISLINLQNSSTLSPVVLQNGLNPIKGSVHIDQNGLTIQVDSNNTSNLLIRVEYLSPVATDSETLFQPTFGGLDTLVFLSSPLKETLKLTYVNSTQFFIFLFLGISIPVFFTLIFQKNKGRNLIKLRNT